ncbi:cell wall-active antibiotics response protein LiaF [Cytobacillus oceanisediminis]|uniref:cell wall-active antibiotics response protein LiaF n=1 Tax=Cytobacillus oceanisediminis TaxID=665099 RepID=UPI0023DB9291|nr:cell wall-active antibiotics response protein LiaF [Cytobacillus oceanisediminis]MDF2039175.1 cell wall-active antibiotics response protein LiaF [Cytobacillus oceanisediminis]
MRYRSVNQIIFAVTLSAVGVLLLLMNIGVISLEIKEVFVVIYPFILLAAGFHCLLSYMLKKSRSGMFPGLFLIVFSFLLILDRFEVIEFRFMEIWKLWPLFLIFFGINILLKKDRLKIHFEQDFPADIYEKNKGAGEKKVINISKYESPQPLKNIRGFSIGDVDFKQPNWSLEPMDLYTMIGDYFIDFSKAFIPEKETPVIVRGWIGDVKMIIPENIPVMIQSNINIGDIRIFDQKTGDINRSLQYKSPGYDEASRKLKIAVQVKIGSIRIDKV